MQIIQVNALKIKTQEVVGLEDAGGDHWSAERRKRWIQRRYGQGISAEIASLVRMRVQQIALNDVS